MRSAIAVVDESVYTGRFESFAVPLQVDAPDSAPVHLQPWTYGAHLAALRDCIYAEPAGLVLDRHRFAGLVLAHSGLSPDVCAWLLPLALWWATGGDESASSPTAWDRADLGSRLANLRCWSEGERLAALAACLVRGGTAGDWFDAVGYLDRMVRRSLVSLDPPCTLDALDSRATTRLIDAIVALNVPDVDADPLFAGLLPEQSVAETLDLCRALGWTPARVLAAPAVEVQRLLWLIARNTESSQALFSRTTAHSLADQPDSVVFTFVDDSP